MPLHTPTAPRRARLARAAIIAAASGIIAGGVTIAAGDGRSAAPDGAISRYHDLEANKATSMHALGPATMQAPFRSPYRDLEANKAHDRRAR